jgi:hypothetical protein
VGVARTTAEKLVREISATLRTAEPASPNTATFRSVGDVVV